MARIYTSENGIVKCTVEVSKKGDKDGFEISCFSHKTMPFRTQELLEEEET